METCFAVGVLLIMRDIMELSPLNGPLCSEYFECFVECASAKPYTISCVTVVWFNEIT